MASFVDQVVIHVRGGSGGAGVASFQRQKGKPRGKPIGGSGGSGGSVFVAADDSVSTLLRYARKPHWKAQSGTHGEGELRHGRVGDDLVLPVPLGTLVRDVDGTLLADLVEPGQQVRIAAGGRAGRGNAALVARSRKAPTFAEQGEYGEAISKAEERLKLGDSAVVRGLISDAKEKMQEAEEGRAVEAYVEKLSEDELDSLHKATEERLKVLPPGLSQNALRDRMENPSYKAFFYAVAKDRYREDKNQIRLFD